MSEKISALMDNELGEFEEAQTLKSLSESNELAQTWTRYHVIGSAIRRESMIPLLDLPTDVDKKLGNESKPARSNRNIRSMLAVAASICAVMITTWFVVNNSPEPEQVAVIDYGTRWEGVGPEMEDTLNALLVEHGEFASASGMNGLIAYAKFVSYDSSQ